MSVSNISTGTGLVLASVANGVLSVTLNDEPHRNVLSVELLKGVAAALDAADASDSIRVVVLSNAGKVFCAGADLKATPDQNAADLFAALLLQIRNLSKPAVARITGQAVGGGVGLAAAFDISIASDDSKFGFTEVRLGAVPAVISAICLPKMRPSDAMEAFLRGNRFAAPRAAEMGLITRAVPAGALDAEIEAVVADLMLGGPQALARAKQLVHQVPRMETPEALRAMARLSAEVFAGPEARAGAAAFKERRSPPWAV